MSTLKSRLASKARLVADVAMSPQITIDMFGDDDARATHGVFTSRHRRMPLLRLKGFGAAIRRIDGHPEELFSGRSYELLRRKVRRAKKLDYVVEAFDPAEHLEAIMRINTSAGERQGKVVSSGYTDQAQVERYNSRPGAWFGAFDSGHVLRAYTHVPVFGDFFLYSRILGEAARLDDGIMYLLVHDTIEHMSTQFAETGFPRWAMYDMYIGGTDGLRQFKRRSGFTPARVTWRWIGQK